MVSSLICLVLNGHWLNVQMTHSVNENRWRVNVSGDRDNANGEDMMGIHHGSNRVNVSGESMMGSYHSSNRNGWYMTRRHGPNGSVYGTEHIDETDKGYLDVQLVFPLQLPYKQGLVKRELFNPKVLEMGHSSHWSSKASTR